MSPWWSGYLLCELTALQLVSTVTRSDPGSHNRLDLIHSLVPTHFVCISLSSISIKTNFKQITKVELNFVQYSEGGYILCMTSCYFCRLFTNLSDVTGYVTRVTWRVPHLEQELLTFSEHLSLPPVFSGVLSVLKLKWLNLRVFYLDRFHCV